MLHLGYIQNELTTDLVLVQKFPVQYSEWSKVGKNKNIVTGTIVVGVNRH